MVMRQKALYSSPPSRRVVGKPSRLNWSENARKRVKVSPVLQYLTVGALSAGRASVLPDNELRSLQRQNYTPSDN